MKPINPHEESIFDAARQLTDPEARAAYLEAACAGDAPLRHRIDRLLEAGARADQFLEQDPLESSGQSAPTESAPVREWQSLSDFGGTRPRNRPGALKQHCRP